MGNDFMDGGLWLTAVIAAPNPRHSRANPPSFRRKPESRGAAGGNGVLCLSLDTRVRVLCTTSLTTDSRSDHVRLPVARPLWMVVPSAEASAFAGMTEVVHSTRPRV